MITNSWRAGVESCIRIVKNKQATLSDVRSPGFNAALDELLTHFEAMLVRGGPSFETTFSQGEESPEEEKGRSRG